MGEIIWNWATSPVGSAVATWGSDILSLLAIVIALGVALLEQRRANVERVAEAQRERARETRYIETAKSALADTLADVDGVIQRLQAGEPWDALSGAFVRQLNARAEVVDALKPLALRNTDTAMSLARGVIAIRSIAQYAAVNLGVNHAQTIQSLTRQRGPLLDEVAKLTTALATQ
jgi:C4-dicarboxylate-specific signal transduction histidine kinase